MSVLLWVALSVVARAQVPSDSGIDFVRDIQPIFEVHCFACHGPEKQKGGLRLDTRDLALKPGTSGRPSVVPGDPARSELVRVLLLDPAHDEAMPPEGKERLTDAEVAVVVGWVRGGAR
jgi:mono/diheme cytochrome c family protein